jgi:hypothetical protein
MVATLSLTPDLSMIERLIELIESDGMPLQSAIWTPDEIDRWRLYLVPKNPNESGLEATIRVASTLSRHAAELHDVDDLLYSVVEPTHPVVKAVQAQNLGPVERRRKISGAYGGGQYLDEAYVFRLAA